jgi:STIP1 family protein 1
LKYDVPLDYSYYTSLSIPMSPAAAERLKEEGNGHYKNGDFVKAIRLYSMAIQQNASNPLLYTNRANARIRLRLWQEVIDDCLKSIDLMHDNMKAFYFLG